MVRLPPAQYAAMIGYLDLPSGLSGDMFLGCLIDAGWPVGELDRLLQRLALPAGSLSIEATSVMRGPLRATLAIVKTAETHHHRHLGDVRQIIESADLPRGVKEKAIGVFTRLAHAEARVHGTTPETIHFHEVGALDAIADIVGVCAGLEAMGIERLYASALPVGGGWINSAHGMLPLPAPATLELLAAAGAPVRPAPTQMEPAVTLAPAFSLHAPGQAHEHTHAPAPAPAPAGPPPRELVTPTAAALLAELAVFQQPAMRLLRIGLGAGQRQFAWPNVARLWVGQGESGGPMVQIETNIDDMNPQFFASVSERLFAAGAVDVWLTPIQMKKGRPAVLLGVLAPAAAEQVLAEVLLRETTTLGVRVHAVHRHEAERQFRTLSTPYGEVRVKLKGLRGQLISAAPEYDDCKKLADAAGVPLGAVYDAARLAAQSLDPTLPGQS